MTNVFDAAKDFLAGFVAPHAAQHADGGNDEIKVFPIGAVIDWYGTLMNGQPPFRNWRLADGTVVLPDGTTPPDLRDRVTVGAGTGYAVGAVGGGSFFNTGHDHNHDAENAHTHGSTLGSTSSDLGTLAWLGSQQSGPGSAHSHTGHSAHAIDVRQAYAALYKIIRIK